MYSSIDLSITDLPFDCLYIIFSYLTGNDIISLRKVCSIFAEVALSVRNRKTTIYYPKPTNVVYGIYNIVIRKAMNISNLNRNHKIRCLHETNVSLYNGAGTVCVDNGDAYNSRVVDIDKLYIYNCLLRNIKKNLVNVKKLNIHNNYSIRAIEDLPNMTSLSIYWTKRNIKYIQNMSSLTKLDIGYNIDSVRNLPSLKKLVCDESIGIDFSTLPKLEYLDINNPSSDTLPYNLFTCLKVLKLSRHLNIDINHIASITTLEELDISYTNVTDVSRLTNIKILNISGTKVKDISMLTELEELDISSTSVRRLPVNNKIRELKANYYKYTHLDDIENVIKLDIFSSCVLSISNNNKIKHIQAYGCRYLDISNLHHAIFMNISRTNISCLPSPNVIKEIIMYDTKIKSLVGLEKAKVIDASLNNITELPNFTNIKNLNIDGCNKITSIPYYPTLKYLSIRCTRIKHVNHLTSLTHLIAVNSSIESVDDLINLVELKVDNTDIKPPSNLTKLQRVSGIKLPRTYRMKMFNETR